MILVDAIVVSEPLKAAPDPRVLKWLGRQPANGLCLSTISFAFMMAGLESMPAGSRRDALAQTTQDIVEKLFSDRILPFDVAAAHAFGRVKLRARETGFDLALNDAQIAATALSKGFPVATRFPAPFHAAGVETVDPWAE